MPKYMPDCTCGISGLASTCAYTGKSHGCDNCGWNRAVHKQRIEALKRNGLTVSDRWPFYRRLVLKTTEAT